jgi:hypothetical protein
MTAMIFLCTLPSFLDASLSDRIFAHRLENTNVAESMTKFTDTSGLISTPSETARVSPEEDARNESIARAMKLLLAARDRVLTLSEQGVSASLTHLSRPNI